MPGIFGYITTNNNHSLDDSVIQNMMKSHQTNSRFINETYTSFNFTAGYSQPSHIYTTKQYFSSKKDVKLWLDGEFYNQSDLQLKCDNQKNPDAQILLDNYCIDKTLSILRKIDGFFSAVIYDKPDNKIYLCTDRYGLQHLHWTKTDNYFAWATEYKAFTSLPGFNNKINPESIADFLKYGYLTKENTWFEGIMLLPPSSILTLHTNTGKIDIENYWTWDEIKPIPNRISELEIAEEWNRLFLSSINRRMYPFENIGLTLSGGLDSRAIMAAMPVCENTIHTFTFGIKNCDDIRIANKAAAIKKTHQHNYYLDDTSWLQANLASVWCTDGEICFLDPIGNELLPNFADLMKVSLNGFGGDAIHGGSFLEMNEQHFQNLKDPYGYRGRRYIRLGFRLDESFFHIRCPFYDNSLIEFSMSLSPQIRVNSYIYKKILLHNYSSYFKNIPWQKSGVPISYPDIIGKPISFSKKFLSHLIRNAEKMGLPIKDKRNYIRQLSRTNKEPGRSFFDRLFKNKNALYSEFIDREKVITTWNDHLAGKVEINMVNRYATFEIWLQQIFNKKYRPQPGTSPLGAGKE